MIGMEKFSYSVTWTFVRIFIIPGFLKKNFPDIFFGSDQF